jgi:hypothetical protein
MPALGRPFTEMLDVARDVVMIARGCGADAVDHREAGASARGPVGCTVWHDGTRMCGLG